MRGIVTTTGVILTVFLSVLAPGFAPAKGLAEPGKGEEAAAAAPEKKSEYLTLKVPALSDAFSSFPVAVINEERILLKDLNSALAASGQEKEEQGKGPGKIDYPTMLNRMITIKLILQEARNIGLDELPEVKNDKEAFARMALRDLLIEEITKGARADEAEVEKLYKENVKEWKIKSLLFEKEDDAQKMEEALKSGGSFDELATKAVTEKAAKGSYQGEYMKARQLLPQITDALRKMEVGSVSPRIRVEGGKKNSGFVLFMLEEIRFPEDHAAREIAREAVLAMKKVEAVKDFKRTVYKRDLKMNAKLIKSLDYEAKKPGFDALLKDTRPLVLIKGEKPLTVAEFSKALKEKFYHGVEKAADSKQINKKKFDVLEEILDKRLYRKEALKRKIDTAEKYREKIKEYEGSLLFGAFLQKVVVPEIRISEEMLKGYYNEHIREYTYPEMVKISSLAFDKKSDAEAALEKLRKGADFNWARHNVAGQADAAATEGLLSFNGEVLTVRDLPDGIRKSMQGAAAGDASLYTAEEGHHYVFYVQDVVPSTQQPFEEVREVITKNLFSERLMKAVDEWAAKLKEAASVTIYLAGTDK